MAELSDILNKEPDIDSIPVMFFKTDGGLDHNCGHIQPQMAWMRIMFRHGLDRMVVSRTAPQHSWANAVERCMAPLNIMLQNCPLARQKMDNGSEKLMKACNNMKDVRAHYHHNAKQGGAISPVEEGGANSAVEEGGANSPTEQSVAEEAAIEEEPDDDDDDDFNMLESGDDSDSKVEFVGEREREQDTIMLDDDDDAEMIDGAVGEVPFHVAYLNNIAPLRGLLEQRFARATWNQQPYAIHKPASNDEVRLT
jgi:hypothetical protein